MYLGPKQHARCIIWALLVVIAHLNPPCMKTQPKYSRNM